MSTRPARTDPPRWRRPVRRLLAVIGGAISISCFVLVVGTFLPFVPVIGTAGSFFLPEFVSPFMVLGLVGAAVSLVAFRLGVRRAGAVFAVLGLVSAIGSGVVLTSQVATGTEHGADIDVASTFLIRTMGAGAAPDHTMEYSDSDGTPLLMDVYLPRESSAEGAPVLIYTHGGGWILGDRIGQAANLRWFADHGYVVFSPDYTLGSTGEPSWDKAGPDVGCAFTWVAENASEYGGDANRLFAFGESAGGALTLTTTYAAADGAASSSCGGTVPTVRAVAAQYPAVDPVTFYDNSDLILGGFARAMVEGYLGGSPDEYPERATAVSSSTYINPAAPPTLMFLNDSDHLVPRAGADDFVHQARAAGVDIDVITYPWADHTINDEFHSAPNQAMLQLMLQHFDDHDPER